jgi:hypothetical protein
MRSAIRLRSEHKAWETISTDMAKVVVAVMPASSVVWIGATTSTTTRIGASRDKTVLDTAEKMGKKRNVEDMSKQGVRRNVEGLPGRLFDINTLTADPPEPSSTCLRRKVAPGGPSTFRRVSTFV